MTDTIQPFETVEEMEQACPWIAKIEEVDFIDRACVTIRADKAEIEKYRTEEGQHLLMIQEAETEIARLQAALAKAPCENPNREWTGINWEIVGDCGLCAPCKASAAEMAKEKKDA